MILTILALLVFVPPIGISLIFLFTVACRPKHRVRP